MKGLLREIVETSSLTLLVIGSVLLISGTYPVFAVVISDSMSPNLERGDVVFMMKTEVITYEEGKALKYVSFGNYGDVIVYRPNGNDDVTPIIHRAMMWVEKGEIIPNDGIAAHSGYITKGDANAIYDQPVLSSPVKEEWVVGVAKFRIPKVGILYLKILELL
ncbi:MAG: signal peptidase [Archaeoglobi archaeon]|nr:S26 family signal peptidase [Candidatus Mnemosynella sp.]MBC7114522.1 S26 family signal peptidase [Candidatus Mnemosynella bozhongmuii]MDK2782069.1 signal peptidase [Archaeoglobi archaeon]